MPELRLGSLGQPKVLFLCLPFSFDYAISVRCKLNIGEKVVTLLPTMPVEWSIRLKGHRWKLLDSSLHYPFYVLRLKNANLSQWQDRDGVLTRVNSISIRFIF